MKNDKKLDRSEQIKWKTPSVNPTENVQAGDAGEKDVGDKLNYSDYPMYFLHDVRLTDSNGKSAQIDFIAVTRCMIFVIECKNFGFDIKVDGEGQFINVDSHRTITSPLEQNREHIDVLTKIFPELKKRFFSIVVFSNTTRGLDRSEATSEIKSHIARVDELIPAMDEANKENKKSFLHPFGLSELSDDEMKNYAYDLKNHHTERKQIQRTESGYVCPNCGKEVRKGYSFFCTANCGMQISKIYGHEIPEDKVKSLLSGKAVKMNINGVENVIYAETVQNGEFVNWKKVVNKPTPAPVPAPKTDVYTCPHCGKEVRKNKNGVYSCTANCGMQISKIYGHEIPEEQVKSLLSGKAVKMTINGVENVIYAETVPNGKFVNWKKVENKPVPAPAPKADVYTCPNCGKEVRKGYSFFCTAKCGMNLNKIHSEYIPEEQIKSLLSGKAVKMNIDGTEYTIYAEAVKNGNFIQWKSVKKSAPAPAPKADIYTCPHCGKEVRKNKNGVYSCTANCGMLISKIYGQEITDEQVRKLLSGNEITVNTRLGYKTFLPVAEIKKTQRGIFIQWKEK